MSLYVSTLMAVGDDVGRPMYQRLTAVRILERLTEERKMSLHESTFQYLKPTDAQLQTMQHAREATTNYAEELQQLLPEGPDKTYVLRKLREVAMWANIAITRQADGSPRV